MGNSYSQINYDKPHKHEKYIGNGIAFMDKTPIKHGHGVYHKDGDVYTGNFKYNKRHGKGTIEFANGNQYSGNWENDHMHGQGIFNTSLGVYTGSFQYGLVHGKGTYYYDTGYIYAGDFAMGKRSGTGTLYKVMNIEHTRTLEPKRIEKILVHKGKWYDNKMNGKGTLYYDNGKKFIENAFFVNGKLENTNANGSKVLKRYTRIYDKNSGNVIAQDVKFTNGTVDTSNMLGTTGGFVESLVAEYATDFYDKCFNSGATEYPTTGIHHQTSHYMIGSTNGFPITSIVSPPAVAVVPQGDVMHPETTVSENGYAQPKPSAPPPPPSQQQFAPAVPVVPPPLPPPSNSQLQPSPPSYDERIRIMEDSELPPAE